MKLVYEPNASLNDIQLLSQGISDHALLKKQQPPIETFAFFVRDDHETIIGGCNGAMYYDCLYIDQLWVNECSRRQGWGKQLLLASEQLGKEKRCRFSTIKTMDWEALEFYQKLGYDIEYQRTGYRNHSICYFLHKQLK